MNVLKETIEEELRNAFNVYFDNYDHETEDNPVPYGDTYVSSGDYITDESAERCVDDFREDFDFEEFVTEQLLNSPKFEEAVRNVLKTMRL
jgi:uncharacterized protein (DUF169 family)